MAITTEDRLELENLYSLYCYYLDINDPDGYASVWTEEGVFSRANAAGAVGDAASIVGAEALKELCRVFSVERPPHQHWINNTWFEEPQGDTVVGHASFVVIENHDGVGKIITCGMYADEVVKTENGWRFKTRTASFMF